MGMRASPKSLDSRLASLTVLAGLAGLCGGEYVCAKDENVGQKPTSTESVKQSPSDVARQYYQADQYELAIPFFKQAITADPKNADLHYQLAFSLNMTRKFDESFTVYKAAHALRPVRVVLDSGNIQIEKRIAEVTELFRAKKYDDCITAAKELVKVDPTGQTYTLLGGAYLKKKDKVNATRSFNASLKMNPDYGIAYGGLAFACDEVDSEQAVYISRMILATDKTAPPQKYESLITKNQPKVLQH